MVEDRVAASTRSDPPWLPLLRAMHEGVDREVAAALRREAKRRGRRLACRRGCDACCRVNTDIPVLPLELAGISRFCAEVLAGGERAAVRARCAAHRPGGPCPFLGAGACAVYPVRPVACRLLAGFHAADAGRVSLDGVDVRELPLARLRR